MFSQIQGDITKIEADVIINAANTELQHGGGVALAIAKAAGKELIQESQAAGYVPLGSFAITTAGKLPAKKIFHLPTICYRHHRQASLDEIYQALVKALAEIQARGYKKVTVPLLGAGVVGLNPQQVKQIIKQAAEHFPELDIVLVIK